MESSTMAPSHSQVIDVGVVWWWLALLIHTSESDGRVPTMAPCVWSLYVLPVASWCSFWVLWFLPPPPPPEAKNRLRLIEICL